MNIKKKLIRLDWILRAQLGIDIKKLFTAFFRIPSYIVDLIRFKRVYKGELKLVLVFMIDFLQMETMNMNIFGKIYLLHKIFLMPILVFI